MPGLADVLRRYGADYRDRFGEDLLPSHRRAIDDIIHCRTEALGGQLLQCDHCGQEHYVYHSCGNRSCPKCHRQDTEAWQAERRQELLPVPYFHVVFTVPQELAELIRSHQRALYDILLRAAAQALITLAADPHDVGGLIGVLCVLHTWTRTLAYHPHVHCLVPAGGVSVDRTEWRSARTSYLVPVHALSKLFRGVFLDLVCQERPDLTLPEAVWTKGWVVYCKPTMPGPEQVLQYLGLYSHRIALTNSRILAIGDSHVCFCYQDAQDQRWKTMTLPALEFIRRFLQHVLPHGFHKVRYYGLWSPVHRPLLRQLQLWLAGHASDPLPASPAPMRQAAVVWCPPLRAGQSCPHCGQGLLVVVRLLPRLQREPP
ncbi:MAG TPA: IS91 family transposase [Alphaproteobacteria bacterium]|nr:IS91 family transposase [Alphaproteobacteria bacterium]